jgi:NitT/TauT family transport system substrate-binding protein
MGKFRIQPHGRLQEWVAEEKGYFAEEGLDYEFARAGNDRGGQRQGTVQSADGQVMTGAFESMEEGRACEVSSACHWAVNMASSGEHGQMWGHAYSVTQAGIMVPPESTIKTPDDLRNIEVGVGFHSGSHFSALQALQPFIDAKEAKLRFIGGPNDRVNMLLDRSIQAANVFGLQKDILEQQGFRVVLNTTFMIGFLINGDPDVEDCHKYFNALQKAQRAIDVEPEQYKHYFMNEMPERWKAIVDVRGLSPGERIVFEPYTREVYEKTHRWMVDLDLFPEAQVGTASYNEAVMV